MRRSLMAAFIIANMSIACFSSEALAEDEYICRDIYLGKDGGVINELNQLSIVGFSNICSGELCTITADDIYSLEYDISVPIKMCYSRSEQHYNSGLKKCRGFFDRADIYIDPDGSGEMDSIFIITPQDKNYDLNACFNEGPAQIMSKNGFSVETSIYFKGSVYIVATNTIATRRAMLSNPCEIQAWSMKK